MSMPSSTVPFFVLISRALFAARENLEAEFPNVGPIMIYDKVGEVRIAARKHLPDIQHYGDAIELQARCLFTAAIRASAASA
jgi:hypothetical protein